MTNPFSRSTALVLVGVVGLSIAAAVALTLMNKEGGETESAGVHGYSVSAIGHRGLVKLLEKLDVPVLLSRSDSAEKAKNGLLILAEPTVTDEASKDKLRKLLDSGTRVLVVLPKWFGQTERGKNWIEDASFIPLDEVAPLFEVMNIEAEVVRLPAPVMFNGANMIAMPKIREPQLVASRDLESRIESDGNLLVAKVDRHTVDSGELWLLTDPDVMNNYGLREADNARFTIALIDELRNGGPVVIDETLHGYAQQPSLRRTLFRFPLVLATMQVLVCALLAVWAAMVRFGPRRASAPPIAPGKDFLVRNTAALLQYGGHHKHALQRYFQLTIANVRRELHGPVLAPHETVAWLERVREVRKCKISLKELEQWVETANTPQRIVEVGDQIYRWRMEMTHGTNSRS